MIRCLAIGLACCLMLCSTVATAEGPATVSPAQAQLNDEAVEAVASGDLEKAVRLFRASLDVGELNITWLNLGRTLSKLGRCGEAEEAYKKTLEAPRVAEPTPLEVDAIVARYRLEMRETCGGFMLVECSPVDMTISIDAGPDQPCPADPIELPAGRHELVGSYDGQTTTAYLDINGMETSRLALTITPVEKPATPVVTPTAPVASGGGTNWLGWTVFGLGAVVLGGATALDVLVIQPDVQRLEDRDFDNQEAFDKAKGDTGDLQTINLAAFATGGALLVSGVVILLLDIPEEAPVEAFVTPDSGGLLWRVRY